MKNTINNTVSNKHLGSAVNTGYNINKKRKQKKRSIFKYKLKMFLFYFSVLLIFVGIGVFVSFTVLFKIDTINVNGETRYDKNEIIRLSGMKKGENLLTSTTNKGEDTIKKSMPYIGSVVVTKKIPSEITITVTESQPKVQIENDGNYILVDSENKVMDLVHEPLDGVCIVKGLQINKSQAGFTIEFSDESKGQLLKYLLDELEKCDIKNIKLIDLSNCMHILLDFDNRIKIELGSPENIDYKMKTASTVLNSELKQTDKGKLDVSLAAQDNKTYFIPDYLLSN